jgi:hypothetical protein
MQTDAIFAHVYKGVRRSTTEKDGWNRGSRENRAGEVGD